jgi:hypothetical protein
VARWKEDGDGERGGKKTTARAAPRELRHPARELPNVRRLRRGKSLDQPEVERRAKKTNRRDAIQVFSLGKALQKSCMSN